MIKAIFYTAFALTAFAFNSILCRMALLPGEADAAGFTAIRLFSGAAALALFVWLSSGSRSVISHGTWPSAFFLFAYAIAFSFAYLGLTTAAGALILFGSVQITMIGSAIARGERPGLLEWLGIATAVGGLVYLVLPRLESPPLVSSVLMALAGISWGLYTLRGKGSEDPLADTAGNFLRAVPMVALVAIIYLSELQVSFRGAVLAVLSGVIASGIGYSVWYSALRYHTATRAAVLQLAVPVIAAFGGVFILSESASRQLVIAAAFILGGIAVTIAGKPRKKVLR